MKISMIAAMAQQRVIGKDEAMPWHLPADFAWFKRHTVGKTVIMGRKTYQSIGRPLPNRRNIVISHSASKSSQEIEWALSIEEALQLAQGIDEVFIIGGASIYKACLLHADKLYLTFIDANIQGDTYFPDWGQGWNMTHSEHYCADEKNAYDMQFVILER